MKNIILFDTSVGTTNKGDDIIMESAELGLQNITKGNFVVKIPTHITPFSILQTRTWWKAKWVENADLKFICGTNLFAKNLMYPTNDLNVNLLNCKPLKNSVFLGIGNSMLDKKTNWYTQYVYKSILSKEYIHGTRDDETTEMLKEYGFNAVTTGCPTLWGLTPEFCHDIPKDKADEVVFTLTGSQRDCTKDQDMVDTLKRNYKKRYFYVQTIWDMDYFNSLQGLEDVEIVSPNIDQYSEFLNTHDVDYIGTRLHGGVYSMQHKKRAIIISIDNRARNINKVSNLNTLDRKNIDELETLIRSRIITDIRVDYSTLDRWLSQFK